MIAPGSTIGILGGGQLGRMLALAAAPLGYRCHIYCPEAVSPAADVAAAHTIAAYDDEAALAEFARAVDVVTYEFENVPADAIPVIDAITPVRPGARSLHVCRNRSREKVFARDLGIATAPWAPVADRTALQGALATVGCPAILKTEELGYDGKGQAPLNNDAPETLDAAWSSLGNAPAVLEQRIAFEREVSVVVARDINGRSEAFVPVDNTHVGGILDVTLAPAALPLSLSRKAEQIAVTVADALDHVGVLCVELFVSPDGPLLLNEIAPRVHNSGHWTIEACETSQFTQHIRAICGLPLGSSERRANAAMKNLIGDASSAWTEILQDPRAHLHLYGKSQARPGRKMGHITWLYGLDEAPELPSSSGES